MSERRRRHRIPVDHAIEVRLLVDGLISRGQIVDLNNAGAFVATDLVLAKNRSLVVELRIACESKSLPLKAIVARQAEAVRGRARDFPAGLGLVFMTDNVMERAFIQKAVLAALKGSLERTRTALAKPREVEENVRP